MSDLKPNTLPELILAHTATIVAAYVGHNGLVVNEIPNVVQKIYSTLATLEDHEEVPEAVAQKPAVPVKKSVFPEYIVCLEDGKRFKTLKRHLQKTYNMTPEEYKSKWGLPDTYPMTAPSYSEKRSGLAKDSGLGKRG